MFAFDIKSPVEKRLSLSRVGMQRAVLFYLFRLSVILDNS